MKTEPHILPHGIALHYNRNFLNGKIWYRVLKTTIYGKKHSIKFVLFEN